MWQYDFGIFYSAGQAVLAGASPYAHWDFNSPYPLAILFAPLALLPQAIAYLVYLAANLWLIWKVMGKKAAWPLLSFPVLFCLFVGQVDLLLALAATAGFPWSLGLLIAKPQVLFVVAPFFALKMSRRDWLKAGAAAAVLLAASFLLRPGWVGEWSAAQPGFVFFSQHASNAYWLIPTNWGNPRAIVTVIGSLAALLIALRLKDRKQSWASLHLFGPLTNVYSASVLAEWIGPREALLSWLAILLVGGRIHEGAPLFVVGVSILAAGWMRRKANAGRLSP